MEPGTIVDRYEVAEELGRGGLAVVYKVHHRTLGTPHALKVLTLSRRSVRERMLQEGILQARLKHPNIVAVTDVLDLDEGPGLLMEYVDGGTVEDLLDRGPLSIAEAERLFRGILDGVAHAHAHATIHRDLKPANVLLAPGAEGPVPKVADFGLAKVLDDAQVVPGRKATRTAMTMGTPSYMSPEQVRDSKHVDERADVFALGCILYELVTGTVAFEGPDVLTIFNRIVSGDFPPLDRLGAEVPDRIRDTIEGALRVDADTRIPSCQALRDVLDGRGPPPVHPPPAAPEVAPEAGRGLVLAAGVLAALVGIAGVGLVLASQGGPEPSPAAVSTPPPDRPDPVPATPSPPEHTPAPEATPPSAQTPEPTGQTPRPTPKPRVREAAEPRERATPKPPAAPREPARASAGELPPDLPTRPLPTCDALLRCLFAGSRDEGAFGEMMAQSMGESIPAVQQMARMDGMGDFDADARCAMMLDAYRDAFVNVRETMDVPAACP